MSEQAKTKRIVHHRGRDGQFLIYLGKQLRSFIYQSDWKVLPMSMVIAAMVSMVVRRRFFMSMEGTLMGAFALTCTSIWNGCFNSIQAVCRERPIIKREHRSGMHITSYVAAHMVYQAILCALQVVLSLGVCVKFGVKFPKEGLVTPWLLLDLAISMFLISYASDMISLFFSSIAKTTTDAMTIMPFLLIFQLVFSGAMFNLPKWTKPVARFTISNYGLKCICAQAGYNELPLDAAWDALVKLKDDDIKLEATYGQIADVLTDADNGAIAALRNREISGSMTLGDLVKILESLPEVKQALGSKPFEGMTVGDAFDYMLNDERLEVLRDMPLGEGGTRMGKLIKLAAMLPQVKSAADKPLMPDMTIDQFIEMTGLRTALETYDDKTFEYNRTIGDVIDLVTGTEAFQARRDEKISTSIRVGDVFDLIGEDKLATIVKQKTAAASNKPEYEKTLKNVVIYWLCLSAFVAAFAILSVIALEFIDKDKR